MSVASERARHAALVQHRGPADPAVVAAKANLAEAKLEQYIRRVLAEAPPLSKDQLNRLAAALNTGAAANTGGGGA